MRRRASGRGSTRRTRAGRPAAQSAVGGPAGRAAWSDHFAALRGAERRPAVRCSPRSSRSGSPPSPAPCEARVRLLRSPAEEWQDLSNRSCPVYRSTSSSAAEEVHEEGGQARLVEHPGHIAVSRAVPTAPAAVGKQHHGPGALGCPGRLPTSRNRSGPDRPAAPILFVARLMRIAPASWGGRPPVRPVGAR